jgi:hypothetical protein
LLSIDRRARVDYPAIAGRPVGRRSLLLSPVSVSSDVP